MKTLLSIWHDLVGHSDVIRHGGCLDCDGAHAFCQACERHFSTSHPPITGFKF